MSFTSNLRGENVIDDGNFQDFLRHNASGSRGYTGRDFEANPLGSYAAPFALPIYPRSEWTDRIEALEKTKSLLSDIDRYHRVPMLDQERTNYCWCYGVVGGIMTRMAAMGLSVPRLSAASAAAKIKNYQNVGGWGGEAIAGIRQHGVSTLDLWPNATIDPKYDTHEQQLNAKMHGVIEFEELAPKDFDQLMTCLLMGFPVPIGLLWWGHLVCAMDPVVISPGVFGVRIKNSWGMRWENQGFAILGETKATPDEANVIRSTKLVDANGFELQTAT